MTKFLPQDHNHPQVSITDEGTPTNKMGIPNHYTFYSNCSINMATTIGSKQALMQPMTHLMFMSVIKDSCNLMSTKTCKVTNRTNTNKSFSKSLGAVEWHSLSFGGLPGLVPGPVSLARVEAMALGVVDVLITLSREVLLVFNSIPLGFQHQELPIK